MGSCVFVASGLNFDVDSYLRGQPFQVAQIFRKGGLPPRPDSGFIVKVSSDQEPGLSHQISDALRFLIENEEEVLRMRECGVDNQLLDFGVPSQAVEQHAHYLPPELMVALGRFRMGLIFSVVDLRRAALPFN
ncbi:MAG: hypothetical protein EBS84_21960 [Proteobacteria bacterium]|nr:hypothetical protein [Verrucomicrobiota bacterium]NBU11629.1 hypothetical protein [Pseudomonadota bacterium]